MVKNNKLYANKSIGQGMMEFALIIPLLLTIMVGMIEMGRLMLVFVTVTTASRTSARYGSAVGIVNGAEQYKDCTGIKNAGLIMSPLSGIISDNITIEFDNGANTGTPYATCDSLSGNITFGDRILVSVTTYYTPLNIIPFLQLNSFPMKSTSRRLVLIANPIAHATATEGGIYPTNTPGPSPTLTSTYPPPPSHTPTHSVTPSLTLAISLTPSNTPTETLVPTNTQTPPPSNTPRPIPLQPLYLDNFSSVPTGPSGQNCGNVTITWSDNPAWTINPGVDPNQYRVYLEGFSPWHGDHPYGAQNIGSIQHNKTITVHIKALFPTFISSYTLSYNVGCKFGELTSTVQWTNNPTPEP